MMWYPKVYLKINPPYPHRTPPPPQKKTTAKAYCVKEGKTNTARKRLAGANKFQKFILYS